MLVCIKGCKFSNDRKSWYYWQIVIVGLVLNVTVTDVCLYHGSIDGVI